MEETRASKSYGPERIISLGLGRCFFNFHVSSASRSAMPTKPNVRRNRLLVTGTGNTQYIPDFSEASDGKRE